MSQIHVIKHDWLTPEGWEFLKPHIATIPEGGGCTVLVFDAQPDSRNFLQAAVVTLTGKQRAALRKALIKAKQEANQQ